MLPRGRAAWAQLAVVAVLASVAGGMSYARALAIDPVVYGYGREHGWVTADMWFDGDIPNVFNMITSRLAPEHSKTSQHPLMSLAVFFPVYALKRLADLSSIEAIRVSWALLAALSMIALFVLLRLEGLQFFDAAVFTLLGMTSAASVFWYVVPEAFSIGSLTMIVGLCLVAVARRARSPLVTYVMINAVTLSMTVTNWMVGIFASIFDLPWRRALIAIAGGLLVVSALWGVQEMVFPEAQFFVGSNRMLMFIIDPQPSRMVQVTTAFLSHTVVMPGIETVQRSSRQDVMSVQRSLPGSGSAAGRLAAGAWVLLLSLGAWAWFSVQAKSPVVRLVGLVVPAQLALHLVFGGETFLYSMHFLPLLLVVAGCVTFTRLRVPSLALAGLVIVVAAVNNDWQFAKAVELVRIMAHVAAAYPR